MRRCGLLHPQDVLKSIVVTCAVFCLFGSLVVGQLRLQLEFENAAAWTPRPTYIRFTDRLPEEAAVIPPESQSRGDRTQGVRGRDLAGIEPRPTWLGAPASVFAATIEDETLHLSADGTGKGMKWHAVLPVPVELQLFRFAAIRYRAHHLAGWGDYFVWLGGQSNGQHREHAVVSLDQLRDDGAWHA